MKIKIVFFLLLLTGCIKGFAQEYKVVLSSVKDSTIIVTLSPKEGDGKELKIPVILSWNKKNNSIDMQLKGNESLNQFIYLFPKKDFYKDVKKRDKRIWFSKKIKKDSDYKTVNKGFDNFYNTKMQDDFSGIINASLSEDAPLDKCLFRFYLDPANATTCNITLRAYVASKENGKWHLLFIPFTSKRDRKIEYMSEVKFDITLQDVCESKGLKAIIEVLAKDTEAMKTETENITFESELLLSLQCSKVSAITAKQLLGDNKKYSIKNEHYRDCENLKKQVQDYNKAIDDYNNAIIDYNKTLNIKKNSCKSKSCNCLSTLKSANNKLRKLYYDIEENESKNSSFFQSEYENIKSTAVECGICKAKNTEYKKVYKEWCVAIEKLLNK